VKLVFCDIDGVLNSRTFIDGATLSQTLEMHSLEWWAEMLDPVAVQRLNRLLRETGAVVVVISSWRLANPPKRLQAILELGGFEGRVVGITPRLSGHPRGKELLVYLTNLPPCPFVIEDDNEHMCELESYRIRPSAEEGLQDAHIEKAKRVLGQGPPTLNLSRAIARRGGV